MSRSSNQQQKKRAKKQGSFLSIRTSLVICLGFVLIAVSVFYMGYFFPQDYSRVNDAISKNIDATTTPGTPVIPVLNTVAYDQKLAELAHASTTLLASFATTTPANLAFSTSSQAAGTATTTLPRVKRPLWPVTTTYPNAGALLPFNRIVAYYGNYYSTQMGVLGEYPADEMLAKLEGEVEKWQAADPSTPVIPALDYIAVTAQGSPGDDGMYRLRMPDSQIDYTLSLANQIHGLVFLDIQVGLSNLQTELPLLEKYLAMPNVHLSIDPEFSMKTGSPPGTVIGTFDASDINYAAQYLAQIVRENNLPPKILVVHRFTENMVTNYKEIQPLPEVQIVMDMDGWGTAAKKISTYNSFIYSEPVQFTGFKLFYKNDVRTASSTMMTPAQVLKLTPEPSYIQYQ